MNLTISGVEPEKWCEEQWKTWRSYPLKTTDGIDTSLGALESSVAMRVFQGLFLGAPPFSIPSSAIQKEQSAAATAAVAVSSVALGIGAVVDTLYTTTFAFPNRRWERLFYLYALIQAIGLERFNQLPHKEVKNLGQIKAKEISTAVSWYVVPPKDRKRKDGGMAIKTLGKFAFVLKIPGEAVMSCQYDDERPYLLVVSLNGKTRGYNFDENSKGPSQIDSPTYLARFLTIVERFLNGETSGREAP